MNRAARWLTRLAAAFVALAAAGVHAGGPMSICNDAAKTPISYSPATVNLNYDLGNLGPRTKAQADAIVTNAVALWTNVPTATITIGRGADLPVDVTALNYPMYDSKFGDGINPVIYDTDGSIIETYLGLAQKSFVLGFAGSAYYLAPTCRYAEGQAVINGFISVTDTTLSIVLAHEIGHLIGLDHTQLDGAQGGLAQSNYPLMYPFADRSALTLHEDDVAAVSALYPDATLNSVYGQVSGVFVLADGVTPVRGANLWATETTTSRVYSIVSDYRTQNTGFFKLLLPPGNYQLRAGAIHPGYDGGSSVGPYSEYPTDPSFQPPMYVGGVPMATLTLGNSSPRSITITAGCAATATFKFDGTGTVADCGAPPPPPPPAPTLFRAYLAPNGVDTNPCTLAAPCRLLPAALATVIDGGEVWMLASANYNAGPVNVNKSVTILAVPGALGSVVALGGNAINIATAGAKVTLRNLVIVPFVGGGGTGGINMTAGASLTVDNCLVANLPGVGISVNANGASVLVTETVIRGNGGSGLYVADGARATVSRATISGNANVGVYAQGNLAGSTTTADVADSTIDVNDIGVGALSLAGSAVVKVSVRDSQLVRNTTAGAIAQSNAAASVTLSVSNNIIANNLYGIYTGTAGANVWASRNTVSDNGFGLANGGSGGLLQSAGDNAVRNNGNDASGAISLSPGL